VIGVTTPMMPTTIFHYFLHVYARHLIERCSFTFMLTIMLTTSFSPFCSGAFGCPNFWSPLPGRNWCSRKGQGGNPVGEQHPRRKLGAVAEDLAVRVRGPWRTRVCCGGWLATGVRLHAARAGQHASALLAKRHHPIIFTLFFCVTVCPDIPWS
jgi:hypothetical protein